jgi:thiamine biosynthesis lipoprotein
LLKVVGYRHLILSNDTARLDAAGASVNLGGIAKGYAVDVCYAELIHTFKLKNFMIDLGGNIRCGGTAASGRDWIVGVRNPFERDGLVGTLALSPGMAVGTSGNYEQFHVVGRQRYTHIIDPHTGFPVQGMASVTVVSTNAVDTEGISKPLFILGAERSRPLLAGGKGRHALFIPDRQPVRLYMTPGFRNHFRPEPQFTDRVVELMPDTNVTAVINEAAR